MYVYIGSLTSKLSSEPISSTNIYHQLPVYCEPSYEHEHYEPLLNTYEQLRVTAPLASANPSPGRAHYPPGGNLVSHTADEPDIRRAPTSIAELPTERDNDAALALGARQHELAASHYRNPVVHVNIMASQLHLTLSH